MVTNAQVALIAVIPSLTAVLTALDVFLLQRRAFKKLGRHFEQSYSPHSTDWADYRAQVEAQRAEFHAELARLKVIGPNHHLDC